jgi:acyl-CoA reductase-like NAD-dependent aldehyde dehydrogenase
MQSAPSTDWDSTHYGARKFVGIYSDMNDAIKAAEAGYRAVRAMSVEQREKIITEIRRLTREEAFAIRYHMGFSGNEDKNSIGKALEMYPLAFALSVADMEASYYLEGSNK